MTLRLAGVSYRYAGAPGVALDDVSLELGDGEVVGVAGASESGKTTLCLVACGLAPRTVGGAIKGHVLLDGRDVEGMPMYEMAARVGIGFQSPATQISQVAGTVFEEVAFGPMNLGLPRDQTIDRTWEALAAIRIEELAERDPLHLSGGQQQLVAIAGLLAMDPRHLVLDEPTSQLDPGGTSLVAEAIARLASGGRSILVAEQKTDLLARVSARVVVLDAGRIAEHGTGGSLDGDPRLADLGVAAPSSVRLRTLAAASGMPADRMEALDG